MPVAQTARPVKARRKSSGTRKNRRGQRARRRCGPDSERGNDTSTVPWATLARWLWASREWRAGDLDRCRANRVDPGSDVCHVTGSHNTPYTSRNLDCVIRQTTGRGKCRSDAHSALFCARHGSDPELSLVQNRSGSQHHLDKKERVRNSLLHKTSHVTKSARPCSRLPQLNFWTSDEHDFVKVAENYKCLNQHGIGPWKLWAFRAPTQLRHARCTNKCCVDLARS